ncbi:hypothetical protein [Alloalcanivorax marinus]|uniref:hypothetical protein n=1 Tax=Alloalcanivorax marinus TaxID=1177169 RepID=UPI0019574B1F|nr:hypothetical protein [Alloalcanivorax marinus]MBM7334991.1 hypothetical protein [Alloalcanivorax marinus]
MTASMLALWSCGLFFLTGLLTGVWKYVQIEGSERARAHYYVDTAHRASLMYAFACLVLERFAALSVWPEWVNVLAVLASVLFFALAVGSYILHGLLKDTRNQLQKPHAFGRWTLAPRMMMTFMWALVIAEIGGFLVLLAGFAAA